MPFPFFFFLLSLLISHSRLRSQRIRVPLAHHNTHNTSTSAGLEKDVHIANAPSFSALHLGHEFRIFQKQLAVPFVTHIHFTSSKTAPLDDLAFILSFFSGPRLHCICCLILYFCSNSKLLLYISDSSDYILHSS